MAHSTQRTSRWFLSPLVAVLSASLGLCTADTAQAQRGGRGDRDRQERGRSDRERGDRDDDSRDEGGRRGGGWGGGGWGGGGRGGGGRGGFRGGGFPGGGSPWGGGGFPGGGFPGAPFGGRGGDRGGPPFDPTLILRRMDRNGNGMLDPDEMEGRAQFMIRRFAPDLDTSRPVSFDQIRRAVERGRERDDDRDDRDDRRGSGNPDLQPLVPGFGEQLALETVPGFGGYADFLSVTPDDEDMEEADEVLERYDRNRDGQLDNDEIRRGRWADDPYIYDRNNDNILTKAELAVRNAVRRSNDQDDNGDRRRGGDRDRGGDGDRGGGWGRGRDGEGRGGDERGGWGRWGGGGDEGSNWGGGRDMDRDDQDEGDYDDGNGRDSDGPKSYRFSTAYDRAELQEVPSWFKSKDQDQDGQVTMAEFSRTWDDATARQFMAADLNQDGVITPQESRSARAPSERPTENRPSDDRPRGDRPREDRRSGRESRENYSDAPSTDAAGERSSGSASSADGPADSNGNPAGGQVDAKFINFAQSLVRKYDKNGDGHLDASEWSASSLISQAADSDGNGQMTVDELARHFAK